MCFGQIEEHTKILGEQALETPMSSETSLTSTESGAPAVKKAKAQPKLLARGGAKKTLLNWAQRAVTK